jgi:hypothetical protein
MGTFLAAAVVEGRRWRLSQALLEVLRYMEEVEAVDIRQLANSPRLDFRSLEETVEVL